MGDICAECGLEIGRFSPFMVRAGNTIHVYCDDALKKKIAELEAKLTQYNLQAQDRSAYIEELTTDRCELTLEVDRLERCIAELEAERDSFREGYKNLQHATSQYRATADDMEAKVKELENALATTQATINACIGDVNTGLSPAAWQMLKDVSQHGADATDAGDKA